jgi:hypothetical protein
VEYGLYSNDEFAKLSESFVCVRTYAGVPGTEAMLKQYGIVGTRGRGPWVLDADQLGVGHLGLGVQPSGVGQLRSVVLRFVNDGLK